MAKREVTTDLVRKPSGVFSHATVIETQGASRRVFLPVALEIPSAALWRGGYQSIWGNLRQLAIVAIEEFGEGHRLFAQPSG